MTTTHRDAAIHALYQCSAALQMAREYIQDPILTARIREIAREVLSVIGRLAVQEETVTS